MTDSETSKTSDRILQESSLSSENGKLQHGRDHSADGETFDGESGIGTLNEYDNVVDRESTEVASSGARYQKSNESSTAEYREGISEESTNDMKRGKGSGNFELKALRRYSESDVTYSGNESSRRDAGLRRHTYAARRPPNFEENCHPETNASRSSKTVRDTGNHDAVDLGEGDTSSRSQKSNASRRNTVAGDILRGICDFIENSIHDEDNDRSSRRSSKGKRHTIAGVCRRENQDHDVSLEDGIQDSPPQKVNDDEVISTSEDEENLKRIRNEYEICKRHTVAGNGREHNLGRTSSNDWYISNEPVPRINSNNKQLSAPKSAILKRHTIVETNREDLRNVFLERERERRSLQDLTRSPDERRYSEDKRQPKQTENIRRSVDEIRGDGVSHSTVGQEHIRDVILDNDEDIRIDRLPRESSRLRRHTVHSGRQENDVQFGTRGSLPEPQTRRHTVHSDRQESDIQFGTRASIPEPQSRRHTVHSDRQEKDVQFGLRGGIPEPNPNRRATHAGFVLDHEFNSQSSANDKISPYLRESSNVGRRITGVDVGHQENELAYDNERPQHQSDKANDNTIRQPTLDIPFEYRASSFNEEDEMGQSFGINIIPEGRNDSYDAYDDICPFEDQQTGTYKVLNSDYETERHRILQKPRSSSRYVLSDNELHIHQDDVPRGTNIIVEDINPTSSVKIQTPRFTITRSGRYGHKIQHGQNSLVYNASVTDPTSDQGKLSFQHEEVVTNEQSKDLDTGKISLNYVALRRSVSPIPERRTPEAGPRHSIVSQQMIPHRNILLKGRDEQGSKVKFNLSVIEEEDDEKYHHELEMQSQETLKNHVSTQQFVQKCSYTNGLETTKPTRNHDCNEETDTSMVRSRFVESQEHGQQPETSVLSKPGVANNRHYRRKVSILRHIEPVRDGECRCFSAGKFEQSEPCHKSCDDVIENGKKKTRFVCEKCYHNNSAVTVKEGSCYSVTRNKQSLKKDGEPCPGVVGSNSKNHSCVHSCSKQHTLAETIGGDEFEVVELREQQKEHKKSVDEHDVINMATLQGDSETISEKTGETRDNKESGIDKSSKSSRDGRDHGSHRAVGTSCLPCCKLHGRYQLHHPICCWHMKNNQCGECHVEKSSEGVGKRQETDHKSRITECDAKTSDVLQETSQTSENSEEETGQQLDDHIRETEYLCKSIFEEACPKCGRDLQETSRKNECKTQETKRSQKFQNNGESRWQNARRNCDTSSEKGEYTTVQETSISESEDDFNDIKLLSDEGSSSVHQKAAKKQRHRKSYKRKSRRKRSLERTRGSPIRLSPIKTAAYERMIKQNKEMSDYLAKLTDEKSELRTTLCHLELQISQYRDREASHLENMRRNKHEMEAMVTSERTRAAQDRLTLHQTIEGQKREINELEDKLHEREIEVDETKRSLLIMEDELERHKASTRRLHSSESYVSHWTPARIQKLYARYVRAEKSRKSLVYQKRYLVLLLGGFRENETRTLAMIAKMGAFPSYHEPSTRFSPAFTKFRTAVRVIVATKRMQFLVAKSKKSVRQVMQQVDSKSSSHRNNQPNTKPVYNDHQYDSYRPNYHQGHTYQGVPSRFATTRGDGLNSYSSQQRDISFDEKDNSFAEVYTGNVETALPKHTNFSVYSAFDYKPSELLTYGTSASRVQNEQPNSDLTNRLELRSVLSMPHSPPVRERPNSQGSIHSSVRPPFSSYQTYPFETEPSSRSDARTSLRFDSEDLDRKIQTLDNLQQKLSLNRGTKERDR